mgnify:FL=1
MSTVSLIQLRNRIAKIPKNFLEKFGEAWLPCMYFMVEGNLSAITWKHVVVAYTTGYKTAIIYCFCVLFFKKVTLAKNLLLTGVFTFISDLLTHPTHFGPSWAEAAATAVSASVLALIFHLTLGRIKRVPV